MQTIRYQEFTVEGSGEFPYDMLRYDHCWPADSESAAQICPAHKERPHSRRRVKLQTASEWITEARWNSFTWKIVERHG